jgi:Rad3-related DNA helicase
MTGADTCPKCKSIIKTKKPVGEIIITCKCPPHTCPKCKSIIKTKILGHLTIVITCKCPHEKDFPVPDNTLPNVLRDKILEFQEERKNSPAKAKQAQEKGKNSTSKEMEDVKAELSQLKKELQVHEEEPEFSTIEEAELSQYRADLESEDEDEERMESDAKKMQHAEIRKEFPRAYRKWTDLQNQILIKFLVSQSGIEKVGPTEIDKVIDDKGYVSSWNTKKDLLEKASELFGRKESSIQAQLQKNGHWEEPLRFEDVYPEGFEEDEQKNQIISDIKKAVENKKKFVIVSAPTGSGKSWIAGTLALQLGQGTILTKQKSLQDEYIRNFDFMNPVKGKSNFDCAKHMMEKKCSDGNCENCEYRFLSTDFTINGSGKDEKVSLNNESFIPYSSLSGSKLELNYSKMQTDGVKVELAKTKLEEDDKKFLDSAEGSWSFAIKHNNTNYFVLPDEMIPKNAEVCKTDGNLVLQKKEMCRYWIQREIGMKSSFSVYNYPAYISTRIHEGEEEKELERTNPKKVLICDEAQHLPDELVSESTIEVKYSFFRKLDLDNDVKDCQSYADNNQVVEVIKLLNGILETCQEKQKEIKKHKECLKFLKSRGHINQHRTADNCVNHKTLRAKKCKGCKKFKEDFVNKNEYLKCPTHKEENNEIIPCKEDHSHMTDEWINELKKNTSQLESNLNLIEVYSKQNKQSISEILVCENESYKGSSYAVKITPVEVNIAAKMLFQTYPLVVFMSSTIDKKLFCRDLQISEKDTEYLSYESKIDSSKRKIIKDYQGEKLWPRKWNEPGDTEYRNTIRKIIERIKEIMKQYPEEKGLILVNSKKEHDDIIKGILDYESKKRLTYVKYHLKDTNEVQKSNEEILEIHKRKENSVLISPSMWEGIDLKKDLGRFCIIAKAPFAPGSGALVQAKRRLRPDDRWKETKDFFTLIQGCGRCTRATDDHSTTYLLEKGCEDLIKQIEEYQDRHKDYNIKWFTDAIREE